MAVLNFENKSVVLPNGTEAKAVFLTGSIDATTNQAFEGELSKILNAGTHHVMLVLTNVKYINSTGLGTIVKCVDSFREKGGDVKLVGVPAKVIALFEMLGLLALFETHETIEAAVASFGAAASASGSAAAAAPTAKFPLQLKHPITGMGLNVPQPGRFKDPRSGDYFSVDAAGTIEFYEMAKVRLVEAKLPCDLPLAVPLAALAAGLVERGGFPAAVGTAAKDVVTALSELIASRAGDRGESVTVLMVADKEKLSLGFLNHGQTLDVPADHAVLLALKGHVDEVKHQILPSRGVLITATKRR